MTETELAELEHASSLRLPLSYQRMLTSYPLFPVCADAPTFRSQDDGLYSSKAQLWDLNVGDANYVREIFPAAYFVIGDSGCGDYYAIDTTSADAPVYVSGPHNFENPDDPKPTCVLVGATLQLYVDQIVQDINEWQEFQHEPEVGGPIHALANVVSGILFVALGVLFMLVFAAVVVPLEAFLRVFHQPRS